MVDLKDQPDMTDRLGWKDGEALRRLKVALVMMFTNAPIRSHFGSSQLGQFFKLAERLQRPRFAPSSSVFFDDER